MKTLNSGEFLVKATDSSSVFIPEEYNEEQLMIAQTIKDFVATEVHPIADKLDKGDRELMAQTVRKAGELGLMGIAIPEEIRGKIPTDYGRSKGVAWLYLGGFGLCHTSATEARIVKWGSA